MDGASRKQKRICKCFIKNICNILAYVRQSNTLKRISKRFTCVQARMHEYGEVSHALFSKLKQFWKISPENTLINCITQSFFSVNPILKVPEKLLFSDFLKKISPALNNVWLSAWFDNFYVEDNAS